MRVLFICPDWFPNVSGFGLSCYHFARRLLREGHEVKIVVPKLKHLDKKGLDIIPMPYLFNILGRNPIAVCSYPWNLKKILDWTDVVCLYSYIFEMNSRVLIARKLGLYNKPTVLFYRGSLEKDSLKKVSLPTKVAKTAWDALFGRFLLRNADMVVSNSKPTIEVMKKEYSVKKKIMYIKNGYETKEFRSLKKKNRIIFVGRLIDNKGICFFERIAETIPKNWEFAVVGDGPLEGKVREIAKKYKHMKMYGKVNHDKAKKMIGDSKIMVLPTFAEGSPRVVVESMLCKTVPIAFAVGDVGNLIPKDAGYAITPFLIDDFIAALKKLIKEESKRQKMAVAGDRFARKEMDWKVIYPKMRDVLKKIVH